ncbi:MAG TPA: hypothetical protein VML94_04475 [Thermoplasmata archaeon]|nr:hypothetical protein [Thermoplasmata archaeon]
MTVPYSLAFLGLLGAYMVYSQWAGLDSRYPVGAALVLLVAAAVADAAGATGVANSFAEYVFFLLGAGVVLLLVDHLRDGRKNAGATPSSAGVVTTERPSPEPPKESEPTADHPLDRPEQ